jgi:hypothetical protein
LFLSIQVALPLPSARFREGEETFHPFVMKVLTMPVIMEGADKQARIVF